MKKSAFLLVATILCSSFIFAQNNKVVSAYNYLRKDKLDKAKEAIDPTITHEKTMGDPKTWFYYGNIYLSIQLSDDEAFKNLDPNPLGKAYDAYLKALELDDKDKYADDVNDRIRVCAEQFFNKGVNNYNEEQYVSASEAFAKSAEINQNLGRIDSAAYLYAAQSAYFGNEFDAAKEYFNKLIELKYNEPSIYRMMSDIYKRSGDTVTATQILLDGRKVYPDDYDLIVDAANIYLATDENQKALDVLTLAIEKDETNATLFFAAGTIYDKINNFEEAAKMYLGAIEIDPEYFDANYNLGALYYNKAAEKVLEAGNLPLNETEKYDALMKDGKEMMQKALPYLEKADAIEPADGVTLQTLKEIYTRLNMMEKLKGINERLDE